MAVIDDLKQFVYSELPNRPSTIQSTEAIGDPNSSVLSKIQNAPLNTFYLRDDVSPKILYVRVGIGTSQDWVKAGGDNSTFGVDTYTTGLGGVQSGQVVFITSANTVVPADSNNVICSNKVVGVAINSSLQGETCYVRHKGKIVNPSWTGTYVTGDIVYCGTAGDITKTPNMNLSKFIQKIGVFTNDDGELLIDLAESVELE